MTMRGKIKTQDEGRRRREAEKAERATKAERVFSSLVAVRCCHQSFAVPFCFLPLFLSFSAMTLITFDFVIRKKCESVDLVSARFRGDVCLKSTLVDAITGKNVSRSAFGETAAMCSDAGAASRLKLSSLDRRRICRITADPGDSSEYIFEDITLHNKNILEKTAMN